MDIESADALHSWLRGEFWGEGFFVRGGGSGSGGREGGLHDMAVNDGFILLFFSCLFFYIFVPLSLAFFSSTLPASRWGAPFFRFLFVF